MKNNIYKLEICNYVNFTIMITLTIRIAIETKIYLLLI